MAFEPLNWPAPKQVGQPLYIAASLLPDELNGLIGLGWDVVDVRTLPEDSDASRAEALKCWLAGLRSGTIEVDKSRREFIELEAKSLGLLTTKSVSDKKRNSQVEETDLNEILNFKSALAFRGTYQKQPEDILPKRKPGRPTGAMGSKRLGNELPGLRKDKSSGQDD